MVLLVIVLIVFVIGISLHAIFRYRKRRKQEKSETGAKQLTYKSRLNKVSSRTNLDTDDLDYLNVTRYNSRIDYRTPGKGNASGSDTDYSDWGE
jgi:FtsZ-interacting cell division protein ZipA